MLGGLMNGRFWRLGVATIALTLAGTVAAQEPTSSWRKAAWAMQTLEPAARETLRVKWGEPIFTQPVALAEAAILTDDSDLVLPGMPLAKAPVTLRLAKGARFYRVATADPAHRTYCGGDGGYKAANAMIKLESRLCLVDETGDGVFDQLMLGTLSRPPSGAGALGGVAFELVRMFFTGDAGFQPMVLSADSRHRIAARFTTARPETRLLSVGPVLMREKQAFAAGLMLVGAEGKGRVTTLFDPAVDSPVTDRYPKMLTKEPQFKHLRPVQLDRLPGTIDLGGASVVVKAIDAEGAEIEIVRDFGDAPVPVALAGLILTDGH